jgi:hypothetical protein
MKRKRRVGEVVCNCRAYPFPHRMMGGNCNGGAFVGAHFEANVWSGCRDCILREVREEMDCEYVCQVAEGREATLNCPALDEHIRYNEIRLYGVNKPATRCKSARGFTTH